MQWNLVIFVHVTNLPTAMKNRARLLLAAAVLVSFAACDAFRSLSGGSGATSLGKPYEIVVVCAPQQWDGPVGETLRGLLQAPVEYVNQTEPSFDLLRVLPRGFTNMTTRQRNILKVEIDPSVPEDETSITAEYDWRAAPQIVLTLKGPSDAALLQYLAAHGRELVYVLEKTERDRAVDYAARFNEKYVSQVIEETFGVDMTVPKGYVLAKSESDFLWARYEYPTASQGFCIYTYPYAGRESLSRGALLDARNKFVSRIPGPSDGSYMTTSDAFVPDLRMFRLKGRTWTEMRGFWDVAGDFMGGPFVSYTTVDEASNRVFTLDCYVYSPKLNKRNFLRGVEHLLYMVRFPADGAAAEGGEGRSDTGEPLYGAR